jgi:hypothetical protein
MKLIILLIIEYFKHYNPNIEHLRLDHQYNKDVLLNNHMLNNIMYPFHLQQS